MGPAQLCSSSQVLEFIGQSSIRVIHRLARSDPFTAYNRES